MRGCTSFCTGRRLSDENPVTSPAAVLVVAVPVFARPRRRDGSRGGGRRLAHSGPGTPARKLWHLRRRRRKVYRGSERESRSTNIDGFHFWPHERCCHRERYPIV